MAFRLHWLRGMPRHAAVLKLAADKAGWPGFDGGNKPLAAGRARGVALHESFGSIVAQVVEVSLVNGRPRVHRVVVAADIGTVVNPGIVAQQMEGAVVFGLTAALYGRIDIKDGVVQQTNYPSYPLLTLAECPVIETHLLPSTRPPAGVGEPGTPADRPGGGQCAVRADRQAGAGAAAGLKLTSPTAEAQTRPIDACVAGGPRCGDVAPGVTLSAAPR